MEKAFIRTKLLDYNRQLKQMAGTFNSFEIVYDYLNFITSDKYLAGLLLPMATNLEEEVKILDNNGLDLKDIKIDPTDLNSLDNIPIFKGSIQSWKKDIANKKEPKLMAGLPFYFSILTSAAYKIQEIKDYQEANNPEQAQKIIEEVKENSLLVITDPTNGRRSTYGQALDISMELLNKFFIDEIDSQALLNNTKPQALISFDSENDILYLYGQSINIRLRGDSPLDHYLLDALSQENFQDKVFYSEIIREFFEDDDKKYRSFYSACERLNKKISTATSGLVPDFLFFTSGITGYCKIKSKYLTK